MSVLGNEIKHFNSIRKRLVEVADGQYVLIKEGLLFGVFEEEGDALSKGYNLFGNVSFLVKKIALKDEVLHMISHPA